MTQQSGKNQNVKSLKNGYIHLSDGVHADDFITRKWFTVACRTIVQVKNCQHVHQQVQEPFVEVNIEDDNEDDWLVGCLGFNGPLRQYFSLYRAISQREGERGEKG